MVGRTNDPALTISPPRTDRPPLHANLFNTMQKGATELTPLFPYMHPGAIVPTASLFIGGPGQDYGQFYHHNSVDEIIIAFVTEGAPLATGQVYCGGRVHGVNSFLKDQTKAGSFALFSVTQRQLEQGSQPEALTVLCEKCRVEIFRCEWDGSSPPEANEVEHPFAGSAALSGQFNEFNSDPDQRRCKACGHENRRFPAEKWGWERYGTQSQAVAAAKQRLSKAVEGSGS
jgi:hypothetical protein